MRTLETPAPGVKHKISKEAGILLMQLPFWTPLIPPQGIARLKAYLKRFGYENVITIDANVEMDFKNLYEKYFDTAKTYIPPEKQGNFYDNGHDLLKNHCMVKLNPPNQGNYSYIQLIKQFYLETYLCNLSDESINHLDGIIRIFYEKFENYLVDLLKKEQPAVLGLTVHSGNLPASMFAYQLAKKYHPGLMTVMGGSIFAAELGLNTPDFELFLKKTEPYLDRLIVGQGERAFLKLLAGEIPPDHRVITAPDLEGEILDISSFERPDLTDFELEKYSCMAGYCSKSCPNRCSFCNERAFFGDFQPRNPLQAVEEMIDIYQQSGVKLFYMLDVIMNDVITDFTAELRKHELPIYFDCYLRVADPVCNPDNALSWRQGGCYRARLGVESGSQRMLDLIGKEIKVEQTKAALASLARAGIKTTGYLVVGLPGETQEDFQKTLDFVEESKDYFYQVEPHLFRYFYTGQSHSDKWAQNRVPVYPVEAQDSLVCQTWWVKGEHSRRTAVDRLCKMVEHCNKLGITNPYSVYAKYKADLRWKELHENAVPSVAELNNPSHWLINERKAVKKRIIAKAAIKEEGDFDI
jgi:hypothetical protein